VLLYVLLCNTDIFVSYCVMLTYLCFYVCCVILTNSKLFVAYNVGGSKDVNINFKLFCNVTSCGFVDRSQSSEGVLTASIASFVYLRPVSQNVRRQSLDIYLKTEAVRSS
jgi:hypothetical protein